jgi:hypothetical protein
MSKSGRSSPGSALRFAVIGSGTAGKRLLGLLPVAWLLVFAATAHAQVSCDTDFFPLYCRGPLTAELSTLNFAMTFSHNATAAGTTGDTLANGTCAWSDRPLNANEPYQTSFSFIIGNPPAQYIDPVFNLITQCNANGTSCVFQVCAQNYNNVVLLVENALGASLPAAQRLNIRAGKLQPSSSRAVKSPVPH